MTAKTKHDLLTYFIVAVWLVNGLVCKVLDLVPRHQQIVAGILGNDFSHHITFFIGLAEIAMAVWIWTRFKSKVNAIVQIVIIASMNILEFILTPEHLLWGKLNAVFALLFIGLVYYNEFVLNKQIHMQN